MCKSQSAASSRQDLITVLLYALTWFARICVVPLHSLQVAANEEFPRCYAFCFADVCLCAVNLMEQWETERLRREQPRTCCEITKERWLKEKKKAVKAGKGASQRVKGPKEVWIPTACGESSIPHTDVHNHHPRQLIIIIMTAVWQPRESGCSDWLVDNSLKWLVELFTLEQLWETDAENYLTD